MRQFAYHVVWEYAVESAADDDLKRSKQVGVILSVLCECNCWLIIEVNWQYI